MDNDNHYVEVSTGTIKFGVEDKFFPEKSIAVNEITLEVAQRLFANASLVIRQEQSGKITQYARPRTDINEIQEAISDVHQVSRILAGADELEAEGIQRTEWCIGKLKQVEDRLRKLIEDIDLDKAS